MMFYWIQFKHIPSIWRRPQMSLDFYTWSCSLWRIVSLSIRGPLGVSPSVCHQPPSLPFFCVWHLRGAQIQKLSTPLPLSSIQGKVFCLLFQSILSMGSLCLSLHHLRTIFRGSICLLLCHSSRSRRNCFQWCWICHLTGLRLC